MRAAIATLALVTAAAGIVAAVAQEPVKDAERAPFNLSSIARITPSILVAKLVYAREGPMPIRLQLKNPSRVPVDLPKSCLTTAPFRLERLADHTVLRPKGKMPKSGALTVAPMTQYDIELDLRKLYGSMKDPGRYRVMWRCEQWESPAYDFVIAPTYDREKDRVAVVATDLGTMELVLMPEQAPEHVRMFVALARAGYYEGVLFYKIIPGVQADTGDPGGDGAGGWEYQMQPEIDEKIFPGKGLVGAVRRETSMTSANSFFFLLQVMPTYAGKHTFFAYVRKGLEVLDALSAVDIAGTEGLGAFHPTKPVRILKIEIKEG